MSRPEPRDRDLEYLSRRSVCGGVGKEAVDAERFREGLGGGMPLAAAALFEGTIGEESRIARVAIDGDVWGDEGTVVK